MLFTLELEVTSRHELALLATDMLTATDDAINDDVSADAGAFAGAPAGVLAPAPTPTPAPAPAASGAGDASGGTATVDATVAASPKKKEKSEKKEKRKRAENLVMDGCSSDDESRSVRRQDTSSTRQDVSLGSQDGWQDCWRAQDRKQAIINGLDRIFAMAQGFEK